MAVTVDDHAGPPSSRRLRTHQRYDERTGIATSGHRRQQTLALGLPAGRESAYRCGSFGAHAGSRVMPSFMRLRHCVAAAIAILFAVAAHVAVAQNYPSRVIKIIVP